MNLLAHALLAAPDDDVVLGSVIGDFVRGGIDPALPRGVRVGIALHRAVDAYTDAHASVAAARALFAPPHRRYAGILLDLWFDHLLARDWPRHAPGTLHAFSESVRALLDARRAELPERMLGFARYLRERGLPEAYRERAVVAEALRGLSTRLARANPLADALPALDRHADAIERRFGEFFPELMRYAAATRAQIERREAGVT
ncbi:MAG TPA: ACP phosphodiesterase [Dokdonella sp.]